MNIMRVSAVFPSAHVFGLAETETAVYITGRFKNSDRDMAGTFDLGHRPDNFKFQEN